MDLSIDSFHDVSECYIFWKVENEIINRYSYTEAVMRVFLKSKSFILPKFQIHVADVFRGWVVLGPTGHSTDLQALTGCIGLSLKHWFSTVGPLDLERQRSSDNPIH